ncbi:MAG: aminoglycoside phosphotransferase family protein [Candidatus Tectomicrobia bacterium]|nr:aminoglycoside phosphotransferase family protein [Candidatus Tectomicrobia bacterium]
MQNSQPPWRSSLALALLHPARPAILMMPAEGGWALPSLQAESRMGLRYTGSINELIAQYLGVRTTVLRYADIRDAPPHLEALGLLETHSPDWQPPPAWRWIDADAVRSLNLVQSQYQPILAESLAELSDAPAPPEPWTRPGWFAQAEAWIIAQLDRLNRIRVAPIEQLSSWSLSCILRVRTFTGTVYMKALPPVIKHEPMFMQTLAQQFPDHIPTPLAVDPDQGWMLLADFGDHLRNRLDRQVWANALSTFAQLQQASVGQISAFIAAGFPTRRLDAIAAHFEVFLQDPVNLSALHDDEIESLRRLATRVPQMCAELERYGLPDTVVHSDLHPGNIARQQESYLFFDWTDAAITHPFLDPVVMVTEARSRLHDAGAADYVRDRYLSQWTDYASMPQLQHAWTLAERLGALYQILIYCQLITQLGSSATRDLAWGIPFWLRQALQFRPGHPDNPGKK